MVRYYKYPFLVKFSDIGISINEEIFEKAYSKLQLLFFNKRILKDEIFKDENYVGLELEKEIIAVFAISKLILSYLDSGKWNRFSVYESKKAKNYLDQEQNREEVFEILCSAFNIQYEIVSNDTLSNQSKKQYKYCVNFIYYIMNAPLEIEYALGNKTLYRGKVYLTEYEFIRFLESAIKKYIYESIANLSKKLRHKDDEEQLLTIAKKYADKLRNQISSQIKSRRYTSSNNKELVYPPCIENLLERLSNSENLNHNARWYLALFLLKSKLDEEKIVQIFSTAPDFDEKITRYQVSFLKKKNYAVPNCEHVKSMNLCIANCNIKNPLQYGKKLSNTYSQKESNSEKNSKDEIDQKTTNS